MTAWVAFLGTPLPAMKIRSTRNPTAERESEQTLWTTGQLWSYDALFQLDFNSPTCEGMWCPGVRMNDGAKNLVLSPYILDFRILYRMAECLGCCGSTAPCRKTNPDHS